MDSKKPSNDKISKPYFHLYRCKHSNDQKLKDFVKNNKSTLFGAHINIDWKKTTKPLLIKMVSLRVSLM